MSDSSTISFRTHHIYQGHVLDMLRAWPDRCVDCIITSPPYWALRDYGTHPVVWGGDPDCEHLWERVVLPPARGAVHGQQEGWGRPSRIVSPRTETVESRVCTRCGAWYGELGLEPDFQMYLNHLEMVFQEAHRVLSDYGSLYVVIGDTYQSHRPKSKSSSLPPKCMVGIPERFMLRMIDSVGFILRNKIVWHKPNAIPESQRDRFTVDFESVFFFTKRSKDYYHLQQREPVKETSLQQRQWGAVGGTKYEDLPKFSGRPATKMAFRTMRTVWSIPTATFQGAHFAVFPEALVERLIRASCPREVCTSCGRPKTPIYATMAVEGRYGGAGKVAEYDPSHRWIGRNLVGRAGTANRLVTGWQSCDCGAPFRTGIVCDIFAGSGTTLAVAQRLGLDWVGIELNPEYIDLAWQRIDPFQTRLVDFVDSQAYAETGEVRSEEG